MIWIAHVNSMRPRRNGRFNADDIFKCSFLNENVWIPTKISLKFVPKGPVNNIPALVQIRAWRRSGDKPLSEPMMVSLLTHICVTQPQWVNSAHIAPPGDNVFESFTTKYLFVCIQLGFNIGNDDNANNHNYNNDDDNDNDDSNDNDDNDNKIIMNMVMIQPLYTYIYMTLIYLYINIKSFFAFNLIIILIMIMTIIFIMMILAMIMLIIMMLMIIKLWWMWWIWWWIWWWWWWWW